MRDLKRSRNRLYQAFRGMFAPIDRGVEKCFVPATVQLLEDRRLMSAVPFSSITTPSDGLIYDSSSEFVSCVGGGYRYYLAFTTESRSSAGYSLYKTDGTAGGTSLLKSGLMMGHDKPSMAYVDGYLYFNTYLTEAGSELWRSDGTAAGTHQVSIAADGVTAPNDIEDLYSADGLLYFSAETFEANGAPQSGRELWRTDGTPSGTMMLGDLYPGAGNADSNQSPINAAGPRILAAAGGRVYFGQQTAATGYHLFVTDGTPAGTIRLTGVPGNNVSGGPVDGARGTLTATAAAAGSLVYFSSASATYGYELFATDGTPSGTGLVKDLDPVGAGTSQPRSSEPNGFVSVGGKVYFRTANNDLWTTDGTDTGTVKLADRVTLSTDANGLLRFIRRPLGTTDPAAEFWVSDGTVVGTTKTGDLAAGYRSSMNQGNAYRTRAPWLVSVGGVLYFNNADANNEDTELWASDGTTDGTQLVRDIQQGPRSSYPSYPLTLGNQLLTVADDGYNGPEMWISDGTASGTKLLANANKWTERSALYVLGDIDGTVYLSRDWNGVYKSDGTSDGTVLVSPFGPIQHRVGGGVAIGSNDLFYWGFVDEAARIGLIHTSGTYESTSILRGGPTPAITIPNEPAFRRIVYSANAAFFFANDASNRPILWTSGGTDVTTAPVGGSIPGVGPDGLGPRPETLIDVNGLLYFLCGVPASTPGVVATELWRSDGTAAGTFAVATFDDGSSSPQDLTAFDGKLFFTAADAVRGRELWSSSGTAVTTGPFQDVQVGASGSGVSHLTRLGEALYFVASASSQDYQLWRLNKGSAPAAPVTNLNVGTDGFQPFAMYATGSRLLMNLAEESLVDGQAVFTNSVWISDGTSAGTRRAWSGNVNVPGTVTFPTAVENQLYFRAASDNAVSSLWTVDLSASTITPQRVSGLPAGDGLLSYDANRLAVDAASGSLFFNYQGTYGPPELWMVPTASVPHPPEDFSVIFDPVPPELQAMRSAAGATTVRQTRLSWSRPANTMGYILERSSRPDFLSIDSVRRLDANETSTTDTVPVDSTSYYRLRAVNVRGVSPASLPGATNPRVTISPVSPSPRTTALAQISINFDRSVTGFGISDLRLTRNGGANLLSSGASLATVDGRNFTLSGLSALTAIAGEYKLSVVAAGSGIVDAAGRPLTVDDSKSWTMTVQPPALPTAYAQASDTNGIVAIEAENFDARVAAGGKYWTVISGSTYAGGKAIQSLSNSGANVNTSVSTMSPRLDYKIKFARTGVHYLWIRGVGAGVADRTIHAGLDGVVQTTSDKVSGFGSTIKWSKATLDGAVATINVTSTGIHTLNLWMREDGFVADKLFLTKTSSYIPSGSGPAVSSRVTYTPPPPAIPAPIPKTLRANHDAFVKEGTSVNGTLGYLELKKSAALGYTREAFVRFDLSTVSKVNSAKLRLFGKLNVLDPVLPSVNVQVYASTNTTWSENTLTWTSRPLVSGTAKASFNVAGTTPKYHEVDLTSFLKAEKLAGRNAVTLVLKAGAAATSLVVFNSDEASGNRPELVIA